MTSAETRERKLRVKFGHLDARGSRCPDCPSSLLCTTNQLCLAGDTGHNLRYAVKCDTCRHWYLLDREDNVLFMIPGGIPHYCVAKMKKASGREYSYFWCAACRTKSTKKAQNHIFRRIRNQFP